MDHASVNVIAAWSRGGEVHHLKGKMILPYVNIESAVGYNSSLLHILKQSA